MAFLFLIVTTATKSSNMNQSYLRLNLFYRIASSSFFTVKETHFCWTWSSHFNFRKDVLSPKFSIVLFRFCDVIWCSVIRYPMFRYPLSVICYPMFGHHSVWPCFFFEKLMMTSNLFNFLRMEIQLVKKSSSTKICPTKICPTKIYLTKICSIVTKSINLSLFYLMNKSRSVYRLMWSLCQETYFLITLTE